MTVSSDTNRSGPYFGNDATTLFDYDFKIADKAHLKVIRTEAGVETVLTVDVDYTVSGVGDDNGGQITTSVAPTSQQSITILRSVPFTQGIDLENQGAYYAETVEKGFDLAAMRDQQLKEEVDRSLKQPVGEHQDLVLPPPEARKVIGWNGNADGLENFENPTESAIAAASSASDASDSAGEAALSATSSENARIAVEQILQQIQNLPEFNVLDYGADPTGATDSVAGINAAIAEAAALATTRAVVRIPSTKAGSEYKISAPILWNDNVFVDVRGAMITATAAMEALLQSGVGASARLRDCAIIGGRWNGAFLAKRAFWIKDANSIVISDFTAVAIGAYVDGVSEDATAYIEIGHPDQIANCYEVFIQDFKMYRSLGSASPTPAPALNYGILSVNRASDCHVFNGVISGVKKAIFGHQASWRVNTVHHWNYVPAEGAPDISFHVTPYGDAKYVNCECGVYGDNPGFKFDINAGEVPCSLAKPTIVREGGTDNTGYAVELGLTTILDADNVTVWCIAGHRYATEFGGNLDGLTERGTKTLNVVSPMGYGTAVEDGSAIVPSMRFSKDRDTGFYRFGNNQIGVAAGGGNVAVFDQTGIISKVGTVAAAIGGAPGNLQTVRTDTHGPGAVIGRQNFYGRDAGGNPTVYIIEEATALDDADGSEDGEWSVKPLVGGAATKALSAANGVQVGTPTGGYLGPGKANGKAFAVDGKYVGYSIHSGVASDPLTGSTAETVLKTIPIPAGALGKNGRLEVQAILSNNNSGNNKTARIRFGAAGAGVGGVQIGTLANTTALSMAILGQLFNRNNAASQIAGLNTPNYGSTGVAPFYPTIDTDAATEIVITGTLANGNDNMLCEAVAVTVFHAD